ncbi:hypothetical protein GCM10009069_16500 [Algimonas arctica]|uniref:Copper-binding protein n=2 Tax=Algimonas arctica TaxID=1479486 RepID=A0A8J3CR09_9PROT|nr:hypothetical protein GCM10009069_16500 [Algimonas arctica]
MPQMDPSQMDHSNMPQGSHADVMAARAQHMVEARGTVRRVNAARREITLQHAAIPQVSWPAADMIFPVGPSIDLSRLSPGQPVQFTLHRAPNGSLPLVELCPAQGVHVTPGLCADGMNHGAMDHSKMNHSAHGTHD